MSSLAWMPFYVSDYLADTGHLTTVEHGAYLLLIMHYWQHGGLPPEDRKLANICRLSGKGWASVRGTMVGLFLGDDWKHPRIEKELEKARDVSGKRHAAGKAGAEARHGKGKAEATQAAKQTHTPLPSPKPSSVLSSEVVNTTPRDEPPGLRGKYDLDEIEVACRSAAGLSEAENAGLLDLSPLTELLEAGYDLEANILPILRAKAEQGKTPSTWRYYVKAIVEAKASNGRLIGPLGPASTFDPSKPASVFVRQDDPQFGTLRERYKTEKGKDPPLYEKVGGAGWWFDPAWLPSEHGVAA